MSLFSGSMPPPAHLHGSPHEMHAPMQQQRQQQFASSSGGLLFNHDSSHESLNQGANTHYSSAEVLSSSYESQQQQQQQAEQQSEQQQISASDNSDSSAASQSGGVWGSMVRYVTGSVLGSGAFSKVYLAIDRFTGEKWALKKIDKHVIGEQGWVNLQREVEIMASIEHPNVLRLREIIEETEFVYLVLEYIPGGELFELIARPGKKFTEKDASTLMRQVLMGIGYLHSVGVAHRDLKPENLLCSGENFANGDRVVIADFGLSKIFARGELLTTHCGTQNYAAPEVLRGDPVYSNACDLWSVGVICYVILSGRFPFHDPDSGQLTRRIISGEYNFPDDFWASISQEAKNFISCLLVVEPTQRLTAEQAIDHPWIQNESALGDTFDLSASMEIFNTQRRRGGAQGSMEMFDDGQFTGVGLGYAQHAPLEFELSTTYSDDEVEFV